MRTHHSFIAILRVTLAALPSAQAQGYAQAPATPTQPPASRGQLLYATHCIACHTTQMHWRDQRVVSDWAGLLAQVRAWQARAQLQWSDADICPRIGIR